MPRPRIHPVGQEPTGAQRRAAADARLLAAGGRVTRIRLSAAASAAIATLRVAHHLPTDTAAIEHALTKTKAVSAKPDSPIAPPASEESSL